MWADYKSARAGYSCPLTPSKSVAPQTGDIAVAVVFSMLIVFLFVHDIIDINCAQLDVLYFIRPVIQ